MINHFIVTASRHIAKNPWVFAANVFGFTLNFIVVIFGLGYVLFETSVDRFHEKRDRIYRAIVSVAAFDNEILSTTSGLLAPTVVDNYPEVAAAVRIYYMQSVGIDVLPSIRV